MIRQISAIEIPILHECAHSFFVESCLPGTLSFKRFREVWESLINSGIGSIFVNESGGKVTGILGGMFFACTMTGEMEALEGFWFVLPEQRGSGSAIRLLKAFEEEGKRRGCTRVKMVHLMNVNPDLAEDLYKRMGYELLQVNYSKEL